MDLARTLLDGAILSVAATLYMLITLRIEARIWLGDYPQRIQDAVPPKDEREKRLSLILGIPFLLLLLAGPLISTLLLKRRSEGAISYLALLANAFGVSLVFDLVDWLVLDWLVFCAIAPRFIVLPGTEGMAGYKDYGFHFRGFLVGCVVSAVAGAIIAGIVRVV